MLQLFLRNLTGSTICIEAQDASQPVAELKALIQQQEGVPCEHCGLVYAGRQLQDERSLESYAIGEGSTVHLVLRLRGGKGGFGALLRGQGRDGKVTTNFDAMRDLQGRRLRHQVAEQKLQEWKSQAKERELEKIAQQHITELARQQKKEEREKVDVHSVVAAQEEAVAKTQAAVQDAIAAGAVAPAKGAAAKRKTEDAGNSKAGPSGGAKKPKMLACLEDLSDVSDLSDSDEDA